jgi:predicted MPP superfamily phosphohydrolase
VSKNLIIFGFSTLLFLILWNFKSGEVENLKELQKELQTLEENGVLLTDLRDRWDNKKDDEKSINYLKKMNPKVKQKNSSIFFRFEEPLNKRDLEKITASILKSNLKIRKLEIDKVDEHNALLSLEVSK